MGILEVQNGVYGFSLGGFFYTYGWCMGWTRGFVPQKQFYEPVHRLGPMYVDFSRKDAWLFGGGFKRLSFLFLLFWCVCFFFSKF
ncbi:hypothetical protein EDC01DRAFT_672593, partial [Geopyxis carbonaria]